MWRDWLVASNFIIVGSFKSVYTSICAGSELLHLYVFARVTKIATLSGYGSLSGFESILKAFLD